MELQERNAMAMEAGAMPGRFIPPSPLPPPARPENLPPHLSPTRSRLHGTGVGIHHSIPLCSSSPADGVSGEPHACDEVGGEPHGGKHQIFGEFHEQMQGGSKIERKKIRKKDSGKTHGETQRSDDTRVERQITSKTHLDQRDSSKVPIYKTIGGKRSLSHGNESSRARKAAKIINAKVEMTQLKSSKTPRRKISPIVSRSPIMNMIARKKAQSPAGTSKSPNLHARTPNLGGTSRSPNLHDLSPTPPHGTPTTSDELQPTATNGSKRKPRKLISIVWNDAEPIYIDGLLKQGRCKYCNTVFPASKVAGSSQLARHLKVLSKQAHCRGFHNLHDWILLRYLQLLTTAISQL